MENVGFTEIITPNLVSGFWNIFTNFTTMSLATMSLDSITLHKFSDGNDLLVTVDLQSGDLITLSVHENDVFGRPDVYACRADRYGDRYTEEKAVCYARQIVTNGGILGYEPW